MDTLQKHNLPKSWISIELDNVTLKITDGSHNPPQKKQDGIPMISAQNIMNYHISFENARYISEEDFIKENERANVEEGDVLLTIVGSIGRSAFVSKSTNVKFSLQRSVALIKPSFFLNGKYLMYATQAPFFQKKLEANAKGTAQKGIYLRTLKSLHIPFAPVQEQYRIVEKIEELFSELDNAEKTILSIKQEIGLYRKATLDKLLFTNQSNRNNVNIGDVSSMRADKVHPSQFPELRFIGLDSIEPNSIYISKTHTFKNYSSTGNSFQKGDILYSRMRPYLNKVTKVDFNGVASGEYIVLNGSDLILNDYLLYVLHSANFVNYANQKSIGDRPRISFNDISKFKFPLGNVEEQKQIVNEVESMFTILDDMLLSLNSAEDDIILLRKSILKKAFNGSLISPNSYDEPASRLIERIKKEKESYLKNQNKANKVKTRIKQPKIKLIDALVQNFDSREFTYEDIKNNVNMSYQEMKTQLFLLLESNILNSRFDSSIGKICYTIKHENKKS